MTHTLTRLMNDGTPDIVQSLTFLWPDMVHVAYFDGTEAEYPVEVLFTVERDMTPEQRYEAAVKDARTLFFSRPEVKESILRTSGINIAGREEQVSLFFCSNEPTYTGQSAMSQNARLDRR